ncbi:MAG: NAD(P)-binding protein, partial [Marinicaulis sp.]|nr:NAD(P)-binding protein [Marinicaulis sp.]
MAQSEKRYDVIVIGAGHNGLVSAATLAKLGKRVCVLEKENEIGGMARNYEIADGLQAPRIAHLLYNYN